MFFNFVCAADNNKKNSIDNLNKNQHDIYNYFPYLINFFSIFVGVSKNIVAMFVVHIITNFLIQPYTVKNHQKIMQEIINIRNNLEINEIKTNIKKITDNLSEIKTKIDEYLKALQILPI